MEINQHVQSYVLLLSSKYYPSMRKYQKPRVKYLHQTSVIKLDLAKKKGAEAP